ncbi:hypothetical protein TSA1_13040 [Bradyrhizobium nitroreducens]|uniref:Uncharacterized protein n=1 Tax=Bradyrhizobium nitroreducens TaxID=709803 RepID=A0A2M6UAQ9_9BRAD|nr:hypothetical protein TSA1_13040 [Bradyrhizobium nitroreducens]
MGSASLAPSYVLEAAWWKIDIRKNAVPVHSIDAVPEGWSEGESQQATMETASNAWSLGIPGTKLGQDGVAKR